MKDVSKNKLFEKRRKDVRKRIKKCIYKNKLKDIIRVIEDNYDTLLYLKPDNETLGEIYYSETFFNNIEIDDLKINTESIKIYEEELKD